jgi:hypothetical protein
MTANELADELEMRQVAQYGDRELTVAPTDIHKQAAIMLRQQQAEIDSLRNDGYKTHYELLRIEFLQQQAEIKELKTIRGNSVLVPLEELKKMQVDLEIMKLLLKKGEK